VENAGLRGASGASAVGLRDGLAGPLLVGSGDSLCAVVGGSVGGSVVSGLDGAREGGVDRLPVDAARSSLQPATSTAHAVSQAAASETGPALPTRMNRL